MNARDMAHQAAGDSLAEAAYHYESQLRSGKSFTGSQVAGMLRDMERQYRQRVEGSR